MVGISVVPHCTQLWVMSSRSLDAAPPPAGRVRRSQASSCDRTVYRGSGGWPDCGTSVRCMELFAINLSKEPTYICAPHKIIRYGKSPPKKGNPGREIAGMLGKGSSVMSGAVKIDRWS
jgi:hypothetical protein